jgi:ParB family transcriptional regulator, chromosome partitioning protein
MSDSITLLPITHLQPNPFQPRDKMDKAELNELVQSIKAYGVLEPLVVAHTPAGYQIIAGERRWRAAKESGLTEVPVIIKKTTPKGMLEMALVENIQRVDLNPLERAQGFHQLQREFNFTIQQIAERVGKSSGLVSNSLRLLELPDAIKDGLIGGMITEGHARAIAGIFNEKSMIECYKIILRESASVRRAEDLARRYKEKDEQEILGVGRPMQVDDNQLQHFKKAFQSFFHAKSDLKLTRSRQHTRISIVLKGTPEETQKDLEKMLNLIPGVKL